VRVGAAMVLNRSRIDLVLLFAIVFLVVTKPGL